MAINESHGTCSADKSRVSIQSLIGPTSDIVCAAGDLHIKSADTASIQLDDIASICPLSAALSQSQTQSTSASSSQPSSSQPDLTNGHPTAGPSLAAVDSSAAADRAGQQSSSSGPAGPSGGASQQLSFSQDGPNLPDWAWQDPSLLWLPVSLGKRCGMRFSTLSCNLLVPW